MKNKIRNVALTAAALLFGVTLSQTTEIQAAEKPGIDFEIERHKFTELKDKFDAITNPNAGPGVPLAPDSNYVPYWKYNGDLGVDNKAVENEFYRVNDSSSTDPDKSGFVVYCLDLGKDYPTEVSEFTEYREQADGTFTSELELKFQRVLKTGYPSVSGAEVGLSDIDFEWATAVALKIVDGDGWEVVDGELVEKTGMKLENFEGIGGTYEWTHSTKYVSPATAEELKPQTDHSEKILDVVKQLVLNSKDTSIELTKIYLDSSNAVENLVSDGVGKSSQVIVGPYKVSTTGLPQGFTAKAVDNDTKEELKIVNAKNKEITPEQILDGESFYILADVSSGKTANFEIEVKLSNQEVSYVAYGNPAQQDQGKDSRLEQVMAVAQIANPLAVANFKGTKSVGNFELIKTDKLTGVALAGVEFTLYDSDGNVVEVKSTQDNGSLSLENLQAGEYTLEETKFLDGYIKLNNINIRVEENGEVFANGNLVDGVLSITNEKNKVEILKVDGTGKVLSGAEFLVTLKGSTEAIKGELVDGVFVYEGLKPGTYEVTEVKAPKGYVLNKTKFTFEIDADGKVVGPNQLQIVNKKTELVINKYDSETNENLAGAEFVITDSTGKEVYRGTSDKDGLVVVEGLVPGEYSIQEVKSPEGYQTSEKVYKIIINDEGVILDAKGEVVSTLDIGNAKIVEKLFNVKIIKVNEDGETLDGAKIVIIDKLTGDIVVKGDLPKDGLNLELRPGTYVITEIVSPEGYQLLGKSIEFVVSEDGSHKNLVNVDGELILEVVNKKIEETPEEPQTPEEPTEEVEDEPETPQPEKPAAPTVPTSDIMTGGTAMLVMLTVGFLLVAVQLKRKED